VESRFKEQSSLKEEGKPESIHGYSSLINQRISAMKRK